MRSFIAGLVLLTSTPAVTLAATIPLKDGVYSSGECGPGVPYASTMSFYAQRDGSQTVFPSSEGHVGYCTVKRAKAAGTTYSGSAPCTLGMKAMLPDGTYSFVFTVEGTDAFTSRGVAYRWCAEHR